MAQCEGRGSASRTTMVVLVTMVWLMVQSIGPVDGAVYTVGDSNGWSFGSNTWTKGKRFKAGDTLVFNYDSTIHNVVVVNKGGYNGCTASAGAKVYNSGKDRLKLSKGVNFFICSIAGHCQSGMNIAVTAA
ncbi:basic blue protein [Lactuca sativa]|uniref:Basic blue protein n=1 Tax=Lactuca sativa TaxID=4236 RepID=A0A9R1WCL8_LACSA|nr:basic blue protein [Lactuca sativa]KAJ0224272.1 hypothetical protein LSAT_V11C100004620 [Lactuca sativa]